jgi:hypothetical protein
VPIPSEESGLTDPIPQPFQLKRLTLRNWVLSTAHESAYFEAGLSEDRFRFYHVEWARRYRDDDDRRLHRDFRGLSPSLRHSLYIQKISTKKKLFVVSQTRRRRLHARRRLMARITHPG